MLHLYGEKDVSVDLRKFYVRQKALVRKSQITNPQITKKIWSANPRSALFEDGHLRIFLYAELICGPPIFAQG